MQTVASSQSAPPSTPFDICKRAGKYLSFSFDAEEGRVGLIPDIEDIHTRET